MPELAHYYVQALKKYAVFSGRARRREYWYFFLGNVLVSVIITIIGTLLSSEQFIDIASGAYTLAVLLPVLAVGVRRLHDTGKTGWWILLSLIPIVGALILIYFFVQDSAPGENKYGKNPKEINAAASEEPSQPTA